MSEGRWNMFRGMGDFSRLKDGVAGVSDDG